MPGRECIREALVRVPALGKVLPLGGLVRNEVVDTSLADAHPRMVRFAVPRECEGVAPERAAQIEVTAIEGVPGQSRLRVLIRGQTPLKWSPFAHEVHHSAVIAPFSELLPAEA